MNKKFKYGLIKSIDEKSKTIEALVSTFQWDRTKERFSRGAWMLQNYLKNPVVLWAHTYDQPPIGKAEVIKETDSGLETRMKFDAESEFAMKIFSLYQRGFLNTFSVGFSPSKRILETIDGTEEKGIVWTEAELLEYSAVPVPANPGAMVTREDAEILIKTLGDSFLKKSTDGTSYSFKAIEDEQKDPKDTEAKPEGGEQPKEEKPENVKELETSLKGLIDLSKTIKGQKLDENKIILVKTSLAVLQDLIMDDQEMGLTRKEFEDLQMIVKQCSEILKNRHPKSSDVVSKFMSQLNAALKGFRAN